MIETNAVLAILFGTPGWLEVVIVLVIAVLLFGKRLPEVGKSLGKGIVEFKKGLHGLEDEVKNAGRQTGSGSTMASGQQLEPPQPPLNVEPPVNQEAVEEKKEET